MSDLRKATDADYNAHSRAVIGKVALYLNGNAAEPVIITRDDYLIDFSMMEEANADDGAPFGNVTSNEINFTLYNDTGLFSPTNTNSAYFGKMRRGVKVIPYIATVDTEDEQLGEYYVNEWNATVTGTTATITAADRLYDMLDTPVPAIPVVHGPSFIDFIRQVFSILNVPVVIDDGFGSILTMSYNVEVLAKLLTNVAVGSLAACFCDHNGRVRFRQLVTNRELRATLTDDNQVISVDANLGITSDYNGAAVTYHIPYESADTNVLSVKGAVVPAGEHYTPYQSLSSQPMIKLLSASILADNKVYLSDIKATSKTVALKVQNTTPEQQIIDIDVVGTIVETTSTTIGDDVSGLLEVDNIYIQNEEYANYYLSILKKFVDNAMPVLRVEIRGNPLLNLLDKVRVVSTKYNIDFTGLILRNELNYNGALSSSITLLNVDVLEVL
jgi:hypothetical protein